MKLSPKIIFLNLQSISKKGAQFNHDRYAFAKTRRFNLSGMCPVCTPDGDLPHPSPTFTVTPEKERD
jgi:hypothetical protein